MDGSSHLERNVQRGSVTFTPVLRQALVALCVASVVALPAVAQATKKPKTGAQSAQTTKSRQKSPARSAAPSQAPKPDSEPMVAVAGNVVLREAPEGHALATLGPLAPVTAVARDRGWVRVRIEGWVREDSVQVSNGSTGSLSAADLRVDPQGAKGKTVKWDVQVLALETADFLHKDLSPDEPYLLARGPGSENTLLYVAVPPSMLASAKTLAAAAPVSATLVATVRVGRSEPVGVPVLDAQSIARR
jgi:hypothetical protein